MKTDTDTDFDVCDVLSIEQSDFAQSRSNLYGLVSTVFALEPTKEFLVDLQVIALANKDNEHIRACEARLFASIAGYAEENQSELCSKIRSEYAELFIGPRSPLAPLFESIYVGQPRRLFTETTTQVKCFYEQNGFAVQKRNKIPDDHVAYEFEFMSRLCEQESEAWSQSNTLLAQELRKIQMNFLDSHLLKWIGPFVERIRKGNCGDYYAAWGQFAKEFLEDDRDYLLNSCEAR